MIKPLYLLTLWCVTLAYAFQQGYQRAQQNHQSALLQQSNQYYQQLIHNHQSTIQYYEKTASAFAKKQANHQQLIRKLSTTSQPKNHNPLPDCMFEPASLQSLNSAIQLTNPQTNH